MGNEVADVLAKEGAMFTEAREVARNHKYIRKQVGRGPAEPQHRSVPRRRQESVIA